MSERRKINRWQIGRRAKIKLEGSQIFVDCHIKDLNLKGMQLILPMRLPVDTSLRARIALTQEIVLDAEIWVAWHKVTSGIDLHGIYFLKISDADKEKIYRFLRHDFSKQVDSKWWGGSKEGGETMDGSKFEDNRVFARFPGQMPAKLLDLNSYQEAACRVRDISAKGVGLCANISLAASTPVELWLNIPDKADPLYTRGQVVWALASGDSEYRMGVNLEKADLMGLARVLRAE